MMCLQDYDNLAHPECDNGRSHENNTFSMKYKYLEIHFESITRLY